MNFTVWEMVARRFSVHSERTGCSDSRYTLLRQSTEAGGLSIVFYVEVDSVLTRGNLDIVSCLVASGSHLFGVHTSFYGSTVDSVLASVRRLGQIYKDFYVKVDLGSPGRFRRGTQLGSSVGGMFRPPSIRTFEAQVVGTPGV